MHQSLRAKCYGQCCYGCCCGCLDGVSMDSIMENSYYDGLLSVMMMMTAGTIALLSPPSPPPPHFQNVHDRVRRRWCSFFWVAASCRIGRSKCCFDPGVGVVEPRSKAVVVVVEQSSVSYSPPNSVVAVALGGGLWLMLLWMMMMTRRESIPSLLRQWLEGKQLQQRQQQ